jgi:hypothetical protein
MTTEKDSASPVPSSDEAPVTDRWAEIERVGLKTQPSDMLVMCFVQCAAAGCRFEMVARRYADNTPELRSVAFKPLTELVDAIATHVADRTTDGERAVLAKCGTVRNKLFHLELSRLTGQLKALGLDVGDGGVTIVDLANGKSTKVSQTATRDGRIFGWLFEAQASGAFGHAMALFGRGIALIGWLRVQDVENEPNVTVEDAP